MKWSSMIRTRVAVFWFILYYVTSSQTIKSWFMHIQSHFFFGVACGMFFSFFQTETKDLPVACGFVVVIRFLLVLSPLPKEVKGEWIFEPPNGIFGRLWAQSYLPHPGYVLFFFRNDLGYVLVSASANTSVSPNTKRPSIMAWQRLISRVPFAA